MKGILIDTHVWIWFFNGDTTLPLKIRNTITKASQQGQLHLSAISVWELAMLSKKSKLVLNMPCSEWVAHSISLAHINIVPLTPTISVESTELPGHFHEDPADRMIVASARIENLTLLTRDQRILKYGKQQLVSVMGV